MNQLIVAFASRVRSNDNSDERRTKSTIYRLPPMWLLLLLLLQLLILLLRTWQTEIPLDTSGRLPVFCHAGAADGC
jgi:hypothetical protein